MPYSNTKGHLLFRIVTAIVALLLLGSRTHAATKTAGNGNWNTSGTWSPVGVPGAGDSVYIPGGANVSLDVNGTCGAINIAGNLTFPGTANRTLSITTSSGMSGNFYSSGTINGFGTASGQIIYIAGILSVSGGTFNTGSGSKLVFNGTGNKTYSNSGNIRTLEVNGSGLTLNLASNALVNENLTLTQGTLNLGSYTANRQSSGGTLSLASGTTLKIGSTNTFPSNYTTKTLNAASTVEYSGTNQTVAAEDYGHLILSGSGTKTMPAVADTIAGNFTTSGTATATAGAALTIYGDVTIGAGTTFGGGSYTHNIKGDWTKSGTFNAGTSVIRCNGAAAQIIYASNFSTFRVSGGTVSLGGDISCTSDFDIVTGSFNPGSYTITISGTGGAYIGVFTAGTSTILFNGTNQVLDAPLTLNNVTLSGTTTVTAQNGITFGGSLTIGNGCTFAAGTYSHSIKGDFSNSGTFTASTSTITMNGTSAQAIGGSTTTAFNNLTIGNTAATVSANTNFSVAGTLSVSANAALSPGASVVVSGAGTLTGSGTVHVTRTSVTPHFSSQYTITNKTLSNLTVNYSATAAQTITALNYGHLTISGARTTNSVTLASSGTIGISGVFTPSATFTSGGYVIAGSTIDYNGTGAQTIVAFNYNNIVISGARTTNSLTVSPTGTVGVAGTTTSTVTFTTGSYVATNSTIDFNGSGAQTAPAGPYHNLVFSNAGTKTLGAGTTTVAGNLTLSGSAAGNLTTNSTSIIFNGSPAQSINGAFTFYNLQINNANGVTLGGSCTVNSTLTLTSGNITTNAYSLSLGSSGTVSRTSGHVIGNLQKYIATGATSRTFEIGTGANYTPVAVTFGSVSIAGNLVASTSASDHASISGATINPSKSVNRTWTLTNSGTTFTNYSATFTFVAGDIDAGATYSNFVVGKYSGGSWTYPNVGTKASTSTQITGATAFGDFQIGEPGFTISGNVFEDLNYGGGSGRSKASSSGVGMQYADVELYSSGGVYVSSTNSDASGDYSIAGLSAGTYYVRLVTDSVRSSRSGWTTSCKPVLTYRTTAASGSAVGVTDYVGGTNPSATDPGAGSAGATFNTSTFVYSAILAGTAQAVTQCVVTSAHITGVDFGFNYNTVTNTNNSGQGSLRQAIANMNTLGGDASLAQSGLVAAKDNAVFMISNGTNTGGLRSTNNYFSGGIATISPTSALPTISTPMVLNAHMQPGWSSAPIIELCGTSAGASTIGLNISGGSSVVQGFIINRFGDLGIQLATAGSNVIAGNYIGVNSAGTAASANGNDGIAITGGTGNLIGGTTAAERNVISGNNNAGNNSDGIWISGGSGHIVKGNYLGVNAAGNASIPNYNAGVTITGSSNNTIGGTSAGEGNLISGNSHAGVNVVSGTGNVISGNSMYGNSTIGIDLANDGATANNGTKNAGLPNYGMDSPVFNSAVVGGTTLAVAGYVGSAANQSTFANARVEIFRSDNDVSGYGEGQTYLGYLTADASGNFSGSITVSGLSSGDRITGTATDGSNNTSEFGLNFSLTMTYYSKGDFVVNTAANWNTKRDGSGNDASSFGNGDLWAIQNTHAMTLSGSSTWSVGAGGTVQIESGGTWTNSSSGAVTMGTFQVDNGGSYAHGTNNALPGTSKSFGATSTVSYYGSSQTVEALTYGHLTIASAGTRILGGNATVAGNLTISGGTFDLSSYAANRGSAGGTMTVSNGATLKIGGTGTIPSNYSAHSIGTTSTIEYSGSNQTIASLNSSQNYGHLTLSGSGTKTPAAGLTVSGTFTLNSGPTFPAGSYTYTIQGDFSNSGTFSPGTSTVQFTGSADASITGTTTFNILTVNKSSASNTLALNSNVSTSTLTMTQGKIATGANIIAVTSDRTGNGLIIGTITRTHTFNASTAYAFEGPYQTLTFNNGGTLPTSVTVTTTLSNPGASTTTDPIDRYYTISQTGGSGFTYTIRLHYEDSEISAPNSETVPPLKIWRRTSTGPDEWTREGASSSSTANNWVEQTGITNVGTFSLSSRTVANMLLTLAQSATNPSPGDQVTFTISYENSGDGISSSTIVTAAAPTNTTYVANSTTINGSARTDIADADEVTVSGSTITINLGSIAVSSSGSVTYRVQVH